MSSLYGRKRLKNKAHISHGVRETHMQHKCSPVEATWLRPQLEVDQSRLCWEVGTGMSLSKSSKSLCSHAVPHECDEEGVPCSPLNELLSSAQIGSRVPQAKAVPITAQRYSSGISDGSESPSDSSSSGPPPRC